MDMKVKAKGSPTATAGFLYRWRNTPVGMQKVCASPIDALIEVLMLELKITSVGQIMTELRLEHGSVSRCRHGKLPLQHAWLLRAEVFSGIPYGLLCELTGVEADFFPHSNAWIGGKP